MKTWNILKPKTEVINRLCTDLQCSTVVASLLANRGIGSPSLAKHFLAPPVSPDVGSNRHERHGYGCQPHP
jgi:hypothetical protein